MKIVKRFYKTARLWYSELILEKQIFFALVAAILIAGLVGSFF